MRTVLALSINIILIVLTFLFVSHMYIALAAGASLVMWFFYFLWKRQNEVMDRVNNKIIGQKVIMPTEHIMFRAVESSGYSQASGMGYIALTEESLYFELILLNLEITVPVSQLKGAEFVRRLKGVSPARKMLRIMYEDQYGNNDSIAIHVKDMERWRKAITDVSNRSE